jgi:hypothetical protein
MASSIARNQCEHINSFEAISAPAGGIKKRETRFGIQTHDGLRDT